MKRNRGEKRNMGRKEKICMDDHSSCSEPRTHHKIEAKRELMPKEKRRKEPPSTIHALALALSPSPSPPNHTTP